MVDAKNQDKVQVLVDGNPVDFQVVDPVVYMVGDDLAYSGAVLVDGGDLDQDALVARASVDAGKARTIPVRVLKWDTGGTWWD